MSFWTTIKTLLGFAAPAARVATKVAVVAGADKETLADLAKATEAASIVDAEVNKPKEQ